MCIADHVEVTREQPRGVVRGNDGLEFIKELRPELRGGRSIDVSNEEREIGDSGSKMNGKSMFSGGSTKGGEERISPSSKYTTGGTIRRREVETIELTRKKASEFDG